MSCSPGSPWPISSLPPGIVPFLSRLSVVSIFHLYASVFKNANVLGPVESRSGVRNGGASRGTGTTARLKNRSGDDDDRTAGDDVMISRRSHFEIESGDRKRRCLRRRRARLGGRSEEKRQVGAPRAARLGRD